MVVRSDIQSSSMDPTGFKKPKLSLDEFYYLEKNQLGFKKTNLT